jgi:hypothetical protein
MAGADFLNKMVVALNKGKVEDSGLSDKINEIYEIDKLADKKLANKDFKITDRHNELAKDGYFKDKVTPEEVEKANLEASKATEAYAAIDIDLKETVSNEELIIQKLLEFETSITKIFNDMDVFFKTTEIEECSSVDIIKSAKTKFYLLNKLFNE